jgi:glutaredoxin-like protein
VQQRNQLRRTFRKDLKAPVKLRLFTRGPSPIAIPGRECPTCDQTQQLIEEVSGASPKIKLEIHDLFSDPTTAQAMGVARIPAILVGDEEQPRIKFYGAPLGYQMAAIIETIRSLSRGVSPLQTGTRRKLRQLDHPVHIQIIVSPEDQAGAEAAYTAFAMTSESRQVSADALQIRDFPTLVRSLGISSSPMALINEYYRVTGTISEDRLLEQVLLAGRQGSD